MDKIFTVLGDWRYDYYACPTCKVESRLSHRKEVDPRTGAKYNPAKGKCIFCGKWGCTAFNPAVCCKGDFTPNDIGLIHSMKQKARRDTRTDEYKQRERERLAARRATMGESMRLKERERDRARRAAKKAATMQFVTTMAAVGSGDNNE
jgi:hypothetical protein